MGRDGVLLPQFGPLGHAEPVLLVDDHEADVFEMHHVLEQCVRAHEDLHPSVPEFLMQRVPIPFFGGAGEQPHIDRGVFEHFGYGLEMLVGEDFRGGHDAGLIAIVEREQHAHEGHEGLSASHVALQQPVHLLS